MLYIVFIFNGKSTCFKEILLNGTGIKEWMGNSNNTSYKQNFRICYDLVTYITRFRKEVELLELFIKIHHLQI